MIKRVQTYTIDDRYYYGDGISANIIDNGFLTFIKVNTAFISSTKPQLCKRDAETSNKEGDDRYIQLFQTKMNNGDQFWFDVDLLDESCEH